MDRPSEVLYETRMSAPAFPAARATRMVEDHRCFPDPGRAHGLLLVPRAGHVEAGPDYAVRRDRLDGHEILFCVAGRGTAEVAGGREPAQVLLLHANTLNQAWYPQIHALYLARGYRFVPLEEALADPIYQHPDTYVRANGISWLHRWMQTDGRPIRWEPEPPAWIVAANKAPASELQAIASAP